MLSPSQPPSLVSLDARSKRVIMLGILVPMFLGALDMTIIATVLPAIAIGLQDFDNVAWVATGYLLATTVVTPLYGKLSDIHGRQRMMIIAVLFVLVGSVVSALAQTMFVLIVGRVLQGIGGGTIPLAQTVVAEITTPRERPKYQAYTSAMFMTATLGGPALGGIIADNLHWSFVFWVNIPLALLALLISLTVLRRLPRNEKPHRLDLLGALLMMSAGFSIMLALNWAGRRYPWISVQVIGLILTSAVLWAMFAWRVFRTQEPFVPLAVLRERTVWVSTGMAFFGVGTILGLTILVPLYLKVGLGLSASVSGLAVIAMQGGATLCSISSSWVIVRMRRYRRVPLIGQAIAIAGLLILAVQPDQTSLTWVVTIIAVIGVGLGPLFPMSIIMVQNVIPARQLGITTGVLGFFRMLGGTLIVAVFGAIVLGASDAVNDPGVFRWLFVGAIVCVLITAGFTLLIEERPWRGPSDAALT